MKVMQGWFRLDRSGLYYCDETRRALMTEGAWSRLLRLLDAAEGAELFTGRPQPDLQFDVAYTDELPYQADGRPDNPLALRVMRAFGYRKNLTWEFHHVPVVLVSRSDGTKQHWELDIAYTTK